MNKSIIILNNESIKGRVFPFVFKKIIKLQKKTAKNKINTDEVRGALFDFTPSPIVII